MVTVSPSLHNIWRRGCDFLGSDLAIMGGAMTWVSERNLVAAISNAGGFGVLASGSMPPQMLAEEIRATRALTDKPFGVNLITLNPQLDELLDVCLAESVSHIVLAGGLPSAPSMQKAKSVNASGGHAKLMCFAPALVIAKKLLKQGADALVIEGMEAGGHIGPVSTSVLAQEILPEIGSKVPVFVAGGIGRGEAIVNYLAMGAAGVQLGTRFVCATESVVHPNFKRAFLRANARDAMPSVALDARFPVIPVRAIANDATRAFMKCQQETVAAFDAGALDSKAAQLQIEHFWAGALKRAAIDGDVETGSLMAGQSVGMVTEEAPAAAILAELVAQAEACLSANAAGAANPRKVG